MRFVIEIVLTVVSVGMAVAFMASMGNTNVAGNVEKIILDINKPAQVQTMVADKLVSK